MLESQAVVKEITQSCRMAKILIEHLRKISADCLMLKIVFRCGSYYINIYYLKLNFNEASPLKSLLALVSSTEKCSRQGRGASL